jgi:hypothetical protein
MHARRIGALRQIKPSAAALALSVREFVCCATLDAPDADHVRAR